MSSSEKSTSLSLPLFFLIALLFISSGASGLIYEVVWTRQLTTLFGSTLYGVATVLTCFMGGLALGSLILGPYADRIKRPLFWYGAIEVAVGIGALIFPFTLKLVSYVVEPFYVTGGEGTFYIFSLVRFACVFMLLIVPTSLMGATLPLLSKAITKDLGLVGRRIGTLYALNTVGAVLGVSLAGFWLIELLGVWHTTLVAVAINVVVGLVAMVVGNAGALVVTPTPASPSATTGPSEVLPPAILRVVLISYLVSGFTALAYQVVWTRALIFSFESLKSTTYSFSSMLIVFLLGLAIGGAVMQMFVDRQRNLLRLYALLQLGIALSGGLSWFMILAPFDTLQEHQPDGSLIYINAVLNVLLKTATVIGLPTLLMGMAFPVVAKLSVSSLERVGADVSRVYAYNTIGAILGSFTAGFILVPMLGLTKTLWFLTAVNTLIAVVLLLIHAPKSEVGGRRILAVLGVLAWGMMTIRMANHDGGFQQIQANEKTIHYEEGPMATISVVENNSGDRMLYVDDVGVAGTDKIMLTDQKSLAHVPMVLLGGTAERTLSVGFGSGGASFSYTLYPKITHVHTIEIAAEVLRAAPTLTASNHGIIAPVSLINAATAAGAESIVGFRHPLKDYIHTPLPGFRTFDPRFRVLLDDARSYLRFTDVKYDVIATDCTDLRYKTNANLYDLEYFTLCREALTDRGLVVVWMPLAGLSDRAFRSALRTFQVVFPEMSVWYFTNQPTHYCLLIGGRGPVKIDYQAVVKAAALPGIAEDLEEIGLRDPDKLLSSFVCDERTLTELLKPYPLNTEDHPIIEFESPRFGYDSRPVRDNQWRLYDVQTPLTPLLENLPADKPGVADHIWKLQQANFVVFKGHSAYRLYEFQEACKFYQEALAMVPDDESIRKLLEFEEMRRHFETTRGTGSLNKFMIGEGLARAYLMQGRYADAVTVANVVEREMPPVDYLKAPGNEKYRRVSGLILRALQEAYEKSGQPSRAATFKERADALAQ